MNMLSIIQGFDFSQVFEPCAPVPSCELSSAKPPNVLMQILQLIITESRSEQQLKSLPEENRVKFQGCRNNRLSWWDSYIPIRDTMSVQKKFLLDLLVVWFFFSFAMHFFHLAVWFFWSQKVGFSVHIRPAFLEPAKKTGT